MDPEHRKGAAAKQDSGFTLLEVMVALMIAGMALAVMFGAFESGLSSGQQASLALRAVSVARSQLDATIGSPHLRPSTNTYVVDGLYNTTVEIRQIAAGGGRSDADRLGLFAIDVTIDWGMLHHSLTVSGRAVRSATE